MNVWDFRQLAILAGKGGEYAINDTLNESQGTPNNMTVIEPTRDPRGAWTTFFAERGQVFDQHFFATEDEACRFILDRDVYAPKRPTHHDSQTPEQRAERQRQAQSEHDAYSAGLRARGIIE